MGTSRNVRKIMVAKLQIGELVKHRIHAFGGVVVDVDPVFANSEEVLMSIPEDVRPRRDQPFYHLLAENAQTTYVAYVSEQNLLNDEDGAPVRHPEVDDYFAGVEDGRYVRRDLAMN